MDLSQSFTLCFGIQALPIFNGENKMRMKYLILLKNLKMRYTALRSVGSKLHFTGKQQLGSNN